AGPAGGPGPHRRCRGRHPAGTAHPGCAAQRGAGSRMSRVSAPRGTRPTGAGAFRDRAVMERRRRLKRGLIGLLFLVLVVAVVWAVAFSNLLVVRDVSVAGADERDEALSVRSPPRRSGRRWCAWTGRAWPATSPPRSSG